LPLHPLVQSCTIHPWGDARLDVVFEDRKLARCYEGEAEAIRAWGPVVGRRYIQRVQLLRHARALNDLAAIRALGLHPLKGGREGEWSMTLQGRWRLVFQMIDAHTALVREVTNHYGD